MSFGWLGGFESGVPGFGAQCALLVSGLVSVAGWRYTVVLLLSWGLYEDSRTELRRNP